MQLSRCLTHSRGISFGAIFLALSLSAFGTAAGLFLYVPNSNSNSLSVYTTNSDGTLALAGTVTTGTFPFYTAVRGDQAFAYVSNRDDVSQGATNRTISVIDTRTQTVVQTVVVALASTPTIYGIAVSPDGTKVYVVCRAGTIHEVRVYQADRATGQLSSPTSIVVGNGPRGVAISNDGTRLYVVNQSDATLSIIDTGTNTVISTVSIGGQPLNVAVSPDGSRAFVSDFTDLFGSPSDKVTVIDTTVTPATVLTSAIATGAGANGITVTPDGNDFYTGNQTGSTISQFSAISPFSSIAAAIGAGSATSGVTVSADGTALYATNSGANDVSMYSITAGTGILVANGSIAAGNSPQYPSMAGNGNAMLATGQTFTANTAAALFTTGSSGAVFKGGTLFINGAGLSFSTPISLGTGGGTLNTNGNTATISSVIGGGGALTIDDTNVAPGTLTLTGAATYTGGTTITAGTLSIGSGGSLATTGAIAINGGTFDLGGNSQTVGPLSGTGGTLTLGSGTLTVSQSTTTTYSGVISGTGGLTKAGTGSLTLSSAQLYTGATTLSAGTLALTGSTAAASTVSIGSGATLSGTGTLGGNVTAQSGGLIAPGSGIGTLSVGSNLTWNGSSGAATMLFDLNSSGSSSDELAITGALTKGTAGTFQFDFQGAGRANTTYTLMTFANTSFSVSDFSYTNLASGLTGKFSIVGGTQLQFNVTSVQTTQGVTIALGNLTQAYDGTPKLVSVSTSPASLASLVSVSYSGGSLSPGAPVSAGTYGVFAFINSAGYLGSATGTLTITKASPKITWNTPATISYGTALSAAQLNATASTAGTFVYSPASGAVLGAGAQTLGVLFTPVDTADYSSPVAASVSLSVNKALQSNLTVPTPSTQTTTGAPLTLPASTSSGLPLTYSVLSGPATVNGNTVTFGGIPGVVTIQENQAGNANTQAATATFTLTVQAPNALVNVSARGQVTSTQPLVTGFAVGGTGSIPILARGIGPALATFGVSGALAVPTLQLFNAQGSVLLANSGWGGSPSLAAVFSQVGAFALASSSADAAGVTTLQPGNYTVVVSGSGGVALAEVYITTSNPLLATQQLLNVSARGQVGSGNLIAGFTVSGTAPVRLLIRGVGPALAPLGVSGALASPLLSLYDANGGLLAQNSGWSTPLTVNSSQPGVAASVIASAAVESGAFILPPGSADSAVVVTLAPGSYTAQVSGVGSSAGVALVEVYEAP